MSHRPVIALAAWIVGCTPVVDVPGDPAAAPPPRAPSEAATRDLSGEWIFDQPTHALYEAVLFDFRADGTIDRIDEIWGGVDTVEKGAVRCIFGDRWASPRPRTLSIEGRCNDDRGRTIELALSGDAAGRHAITGILVDGRSGWSHIGFGWSAIRCPDPKGGCAWEEFKRASPEAVTRSPSGLRR